MACFPVGCKARVSTPFRLYAWKGGQWPTRVFLLRPAILVLAPAPGNDTDT